ncbi:hypothetical protein [Aquimarina agarivorans]|uniref:hypothetical protein n=1 Tax=Aquimarina agarivorans TaxID=980584 RepID=UPI000248EBEE|nr:hypothetical protein [Aquimarina agarivorans]
MNFKNLQLLGITALTISSITSINAQSGGFFSGDVSLWREKRINFLETVGGSPRAYIRSSFGKNREDFNSLVFATGKDKERMIIKENGNVGIGTLAPIEKFQISNTFTFHNGTQKIIGFNYAPSGSVDLNTSQYAAEMRFQALTGKLSLGTSATRTALPTTALTINNKANVGIGTTNPKEALEINGNIALVRTKKIKFLESVGGRDRAYIRSTFGQNREDFNSLVFATGMGEQMIIKDNGNVGIGTSNPKNKLSVKGHIWAEEVIVSLEDGADWVFEADYNLKPLAEVEAFIKRNKHLPEMPSADDFRANDMKVSEMTNRLLQKIEELTLYTIEQEKQLQTQNEKLKNLESLEQKNASLEQRLSKLEQLLN